MAYNRNNNQLTKTQFINLSLSKLGSDRVQLADYDADNTEIKELIDIYYESSLLETINACNWNCCTIREKVSTSGLSGSGTSSSHVFPYNKQVIIQGSSKATAWDAIRVIEVQSLNSSNLTKIDNQTATSKVMWEQRFDKLLICLNAGHQGSVAIKYTTIPITNVGSGSDFMFLDSLFTKCWYTKLAASLAMPLTGQKDLEQVLLDELNNICLPEAKRVNATEGTQSVPIGEDFNEIQSINTYNNFRKV